MQVQADALLDRTRSLADQLELSPQYFSALLPPPQPGAIRFPDLQGRPDLDGNCDDWSNNSDWIIESTSLRYLSGRVGADYYLCLSIADTEVQYHRANSGQLALGDHLLVYTDSQRYWLRTENTGAFWAVFLDQLDALQPEYNLNAFWRETESGYLLEIRIPRYLAEARLGIEVVNNGSSTIASLALGQDGRPLKYIEIKEDLQQLLVQHEDNRREESIYLLSNSGSLAARLNQQYSDLNQAQSWLTNLYEVFSPQDFVGDLSQLDSQGFLNINAEQFSTSSAQVHWYRQDNIRVARAYVPIQIGGVRVATLIADEPAQTLSEINSAALTRLVWYSGIAFFITSLGLITYAVWLSARIRRLSRATARLLVDQGGVSSSAEFQASNHKDELGELSRQYADMLQRIDGYTQYLQSLSSKLSHEIRTPIAIVRSSLDNLAQADEAHERAVYLERASEGVERLSNILSAMSQSTAIESAIESADSRLFSPAAVLNDLVQAYSGIHPQIPFELEVTEQAQSSKIMGSDDLFAQMLDKLVDNAADFCTGKILISVSVEAEYLRLSVANEGPVLPVDMADNLFDSLVSLREEKDETPHLGLGLFVVKRVVDFHQGKLEARNLPEDAGVEFVIWLPV